MSTDTMTTDTTNLRDRASLSPNDAARYLGVGYSTMENWRSEGRGPKHAKIGRAVLYRPSDLDDFVAKHVVL